MAIGMASGQSWLDIKGIGRPMSVMFIDEDGPEAELQRRIKHLCTGRGLEPRDLVGLLHAYPSSGLTLNDPVGYATLRQTILNHKAEFVIIDALIAVHSLDENKTSDMRMLMRSLIRGLMRDTGVGIAVLHHEARPQNPKTGSPRPGAMKGRGSTEIINAGDNQLHITSRDGISVMAASRCRLLPLVDWPAPVDYAIKSLDESTQVVPVSADPSVTSCAGILRTLIKSGFELGSLPATHKLLKERGFSGSRSTVWRAIHSLKETAIS